MRALLAAAALTAALVVPAGSASASGPVDELVDAIKDRPVFCSYRLCP